MILKLPWAWRAGLMATATAAGVFIALAGMETTSADPIISLWSTSLAALLASMATWHLLIDRPRCPGAWRGALAGLLATLLAYPLAFYLQFGHSLLAQGPGAQGWGESMLSALLLPWPLSLLAWLVTGWITVPLGALLGALLGYLQKRSR